MKGDRTELGILIGLSPGVLASASVIRESRDNGFAILGLLFTIPFTLTGSVVGGAFGAKEGKKIVVYQGPIDRYLEKLQSTSGM